MTDAIPTFGPLECGGLVKDETKAKRMLLGELLVREYGIRIEDVEKALKFQEQYGGRLGSILVNMGIASAETVMEALSRQLDIEVVTAEALTESSMADGGENGSVNVRFLLGRKAVPLIRPDGEVVLIAVDPLDMEIANYMAESGLRAKLMLCTEAQFREASMKAGGLGDGSDSLKLTDLNTNDVERLKELASEAPIVNQVNMLIARAVEKHASDLHFEPFRNMYRVRLRIDGMLHDADFLPIEMQLPVASRIKILAGLDIAEKRRPQDGKISMRVASRDLDIRVSTLPLGSGESLVLRFLMKESIRYDLDVLGLEDDLLRMFNEDIFRTSGVILLTGPTGSGKTTTLYSALNHVNTEEKKIITVEDPIEYELNGVNQVQINHDIGYDFPKALRSILRQDPDVLMIGEIRDIETARIAMQASLTGHLVFSTVHTNDAPSAFTRLLDLGIEEFLLNAAIVSVIAQRLVRKLCVHCRRRVSCVPDGVNRQEVELLADRLQFEPTIYEAAGCGRCDGSGYSGRIAIMEYMRYDGGLKSMEKDQRFVQNARMYLRENQVRNLYEDAMLKALRGVTTFQEAIRVTA